MTFEKVITTIAALVLIFSEVITNATKVINISPATQKTGNARLKVQVGSEH